MDINFSDADNQFRQEVKDYLENKYPKHVKEKQNNGEQLTKQDMIDYHKSLYEQGWAGYNWPVEYGGTGWSPTQIYIFQEELGYANTPTILPFGLNMVGPVIYTFGNEEQKKKFLPDILEFNTWWCQGYSEPNAGSDLASLQTKGELVGDEWVINGQKIWTSTAKYAQMMFCLVRTEPEASKHQGISYLLIPMDTPGIEVRPLVDMTLDAGFNEVFFTDVRIPAENIVGERGQGWLVANKTLVHERGSLGDPNKMIRRYDKLVNLMKSEILDGVRIIDKPVYRDRLMKIHGKILALKSHGLRLLSGRLNKGQDINLGTMIVKLYGTEMRYELETLAIDVMGEIGTLYEDSPHLKNDGTWQFIYMYFLGLIIGGGTSQIQKNIIAERGLGMPKEPKVEGA